jgi:hypothetical protein
MACAEGPPHPGDRDPGVRASRDLELGRVSHARRRTPHRTQITVTKVNQQGKIICTSTPEVSPVALCPVGNRLTLCLLRRKERR